MRDLLDAFSHGHCLGVVASLLQQAGVIFKRADHPGISGAERLFKRRQRALAAVCAAFPKPCAAARPASQEEASSKQEELMSRVIGLSPRVVSILKARLERVHSEWVFPAGTASGHIEPSTVQGQHQKACEAAKLAHFPLYTFRHTCLTRWAPHMDPWTLAYLAGHRDMSITKRYIHPQEHNTRAAMERARAALGGHSSGHTSAPTNFVDLRNLPASA